MTINDYPLNLRDYAVTVCRIEPENNIHLILEAFFRQNQIPLIIVGNWKSSMYGLRLLSQYEESPMIYFSDPIYEPSKINVLRSDAALYVHGHSAGGTNPSLVEAMFLGLPVFAFDCIYNRYTTENQCVYWSTVDELYDRIIHREQSELIDLGKRMKSIAGHRYRWNVIAAKYENLYPRPALPSSLRSPATL
jgi:glycosyltransferase involved in cell wall biosynthesis